MLVFNAFNLDMNVIKLQTRIFVRPGKYVYALTVYDLVPSVLSI